ncbi:hypothetical protein P4S64_07090 [Vibrio sp. M60_M31a]
MLFALQLEHESSGGIFPLDLTQLFYATDRFLENAHAFIAHVIMKLLSPAEQLCETVVPEATTQKKFTQCIIVAGGAGIRVNFQ